MFTYLKSGWSDERNIREKKEQAWLSPGLLVLCDYYSHNWAISSPLRWSYSSSDAWIWSDDYKLVILLPEHVYVIFVLIKKRNYTWREQGSDTRTRISCYKCNLHMTYVNQNVAKHQVPVSAHFLTVSCACVFVMSIAGHTPSIIMLLTQITDLWDRGSGTANTQTLSAHQFNTDDERCRGVFIVHDWDLWLRSFLKEHE